MKTYYLKVMYPGKKSYMHEKDVTVEAEYVSVEHNSLIFKEDNHGTIKCVYPANYTIIEKIEEI